MTVHVNSTLKWLGSWSVIILLGPLNFAHGGVMDVAGAIYWRQIAAGMLGTYLWLLIVVMFL